MTAGVDTPPAATARLFVAVWPPDAVLDLITQMPRPDTRGVRYTRRDQWHVTLRFLGSCPVDDAVDAFDRIDAHASVATLGPSVRRLGRAVLVAPVAGLDEIATAVVDATAAVGKPPEARPFTGHITVARLTGRYSGQLVGWGISASFPVREVQLVRSRLQHTGAVYETIATKSLRAPGEAAGPARVRQS